MPEYREDHAVFNLSYQSDDFSAFDIFRYRMLFFVSGHLVYIILQDPKSNTVNYICCTPTAPENKASQKIKAALKKSELPEKGYREVIWLISGTEFVWAPQTLYATDSSKQLLQFTSGLSHDKRMCHTPLNGTDRLLLFGADIALTDSLKEIFPDIKLLHVQSAFGYLLHHLYHGSNQTHMAAAVLHEELLIGVYRKGQAILLNSFPFKTAEDFVYYLLFCLETLQIPATDVQLDICGLLEKHSGISKLIQKYIAKINWLAAASTGVRLSNTGNIPAHYFTHLLQTFHCVS